MKAAGTLIVAGLLCALVSAPTLAVERTARIDAAGVTAQDLCRGPDARCAGPATEASAEYCIAEGKCATALPGAALIRYDARMDAALPH